MNSAVVNRASPVINRILNRSNQPLDNSLMTLPLPASYEYHATVRRNSYEYENRNNINNKNNNNHNYNNNNYNNGDGFNAANSCNKSRRDAQNFRSICADDVRGYPDRHVADNVSARTFDGYLNSAIGVKNRCDEASYDKSSQSNLKKYSPDYAQKGKFI